MAQMVRSESLGEMFAQEMIFECFVFQEPLA